MYCYVHSKIGNSLGEATHVLELTDITQFNAVQFSGLTEWLHFFILSDLFMNDKEYLSAVLLVVLYFYCIDV